MSHVQRVVFVVDFIHCIAVGSTIDIVIIGGVTLAWNTVVGALVVGVFMLATTLELAGLASDAVTCGRLHRLPENTIIIYRRMAAIGWRG